VYLKDVVRVPGSEQDDGSPTREELMLHWALELAERGQVSQAMLQLGGVLSHTTQDALLRYAPPFVSVQTDVALYPGGRTVTYTLQLYSPSATKTRARLAEIVARLGAVDGCQSSLAFGAQGDESAFLGVDVTRSSSSEGNARAAAVVATLLRDDDLISSLVAAPWANALQTYAVAHNSWINRYLYSERVDLRPLHDVWELKAQYAGWRLIELRGAASPQTERERLEQRLALLALQEQRQVWEHITSGSHWVYRVSFGQGAPSATWVVRWQQLRELQFDRTVYLLSTVLRTGLAMAAVLLLWLLLAVLRIQR